MSKKLTMKRFNSTVRDIEKNVAVLHQGNVKITNATAKAVYAKGRQADIKIINAAANSIIDLGKVSGVKKKTMKKIIEKNFTPAVNSVSKNTKKKINKKINKVTNNISLSDKQIKALNIKKPLTKIEEAIDKSMNNLIQVNDKKDKNFDIKYSSNDTKKDSKKKKKAEKNAEKKAKSTAEFMQNGMKKISEERKKNECASTGLELNDINSSTSSSKKKKKKSQNYFNSEMLEGMNFAN